MFDVDRKELVRALAAVKPAVARRPGIPALEAVLIEADGAGSATITATDLELAVVAGVEAGGGPARLLVPYKILAETVKAGAGVVVRMDSLEGKFYVDGASIRLAELDDFPSLAGDVNGVRPAFVGTVEAASFAHGATVTTAAASKDEARPVLTGVLLELGAGIGDPTTGRMVATDSYRLHVAHVDGSGELSAIVPARALAHVAKMLGRKPAGVVSIAGGESEVRFVLPNGLEVRSRVIEGEFPNWRQLVPERGIGTSVRFELAEFSAALKSAAPYCRDTSPVRLEVLEAIEGTPARVQLSASSADLGAWSGDVRSVTVHGPGVTVAFNPSYLGGALTAAGDGGAFEVRDGLKPATVYSADGLTVGLVMPVRLPAPIEPAPEPERTAEAEVEAEIGAAGRAERAEREAQHAAERAAFDARRAEPEAEPEPDEVDAGEGAELEPEPDDDDGRAGEPEPGPFKPPAFEPDDEGEPATTSEAGDWAEPAGELEAMRRELDAARAMLERVREAEAGGAPAGGGFDDWAELGDVGEVGAWHVRIVGGKDGRPNVDVRRWASGARYSGRTKVGLRWAADEAAELGRLISDGAERAAELER